MKNNVLLTHRNCLMRSFQSSYILFCDFITVLNDHILRDIAENIGDKQMELATHLNITNDKVNIANGNHPNKKTDATFVLLKDWKNALPFQTQLNNKEVFRILFKALEDINRIDIIVNVVKVCVVFFRLRLI